MILITMVDERWGMSFHNERLSSDQAVLDRILELAGRRVLRMNPYTKELFEDRRNLLVSERFLKHARLGDFCVVENVDITQYLDEAEEIIMFHWNEAYPFDLTFPADYLDDSWELKNTMEFEGVSHDKITEFRYSRKKVI